MKRLRHTGRAALGNAAFCARVRSVCHHRVLTVASVPLTVFTVLAVPTPGLASATSSIGYEPQPRRTHSPMAFTQIELLVTVLCVALLAALILPSLARSRARSSRIGCTNNLKQIGLGFRSWAIDNDDHSPMRVSVTNGGTMELVASGHVSPHFRVMSNELSTPKILLCPNDSTRSYATNFDSDLTDSKLGYFVGVDAVEQSGTSLLCGDRNLTNKPTPGSRLVSVSASGAIGWTKAIHGEKGNLCLADGSVVTFTNAQVNPLMQAWVLATNRLAVP
jgi:prepilin-type processing-associated H-X9-DG protein